MEIVHAFFILLLAGVFICIGLGALFLFVDTVLCKMLEILEFFDK